MLLTFTTLAMILQFSLAIAADPSMKQMQPQPIPPQRGGTVPQLQLSPDYLYQQITALQQQIAGLLSQVNALRSVVQITQNGTTIQSGNLVIKGINGLLMTSGADMKFESNKDLSLKGGKNITSEAGSQIQIKGSQIRLNDGTTPLAFVGSTVVGGKVVTGSTGIFGK